MEQSPNGIETTEVEIERFARRKIKLGFAGGHEEIVSYDSRTDTVECETQFRKYLNTNRDAPSNGKLSEVMKKRNVFTIVNKESLLYKRFMDMQELFLVSWDGGESIEIMDYEEMTKTLDIAASQKQEVVKEVPKEELTENTRKAITRFEEEPEESDDTEKKYDTDIPEPS
jgi:hypothetical protein